MSEQWKNNNKPKEVFMGWIYWAWEHHFIFIHLKYENTEDKTKLGQGYKFYHYIIIYNSELGQLKEASLDSFRLSCLRTLPTTGIHFNIQSIHRCARPSRSWKCATNTFTRSIFHKKKNATLVTYARIVTFATENFRRAHESSRCVDERQTALLQKDTLVILFIFLVVEKKKKTKTNTELILLILWVLTAYSSVSQTSITVHY